MTAPRLNSCEQQDIPLMEGLCTATPTLPAYTAPGMGWGSTMQRLLAKHFQRMTFTSANASFYCYVESISFFPEKQGGMKGRVVNKEEKEDFLYAKTFYGSRARFEL